jgi:polyphosphate kinase
MNPLREPNPPQAADPPQAGAQLLAAATAPQRPGPASAALPAAPPPAEFLNRDLSWLEFHRRVLHEALDERTPLIERLKFLGICASNLDEFFMKRVGWVKRRIEEGALPRAAEGPPAQELLAAFRQQLRPMIAQQAECFSNVLRPKLAEVGIYLLKWEDLTEAERAAAETFFKSSVFPVLTPLAVDPGHPFPFISNLSVSLGVTLRHPDREGELFARVKVPQVLPPWVRVDAGETGAHRFISLIELIRHNLEHLFPDMAIVDVMTFRITRNAEIERDEEDADDLLEMVEDEIRRRRFEHPVRLECPPNSSPRMLSLLLDELQLTEQDVYDLTDVIDSAWVRPIVEINLPALRSLRQSATAAEEPKLRYEPWTPFVPPPLEDTEADIFTLIRAGDLLIHHPYDDFETSVERFIRSAAEDPKVLAIKMTVYRAGAESPLIRQLIRAAESGKQIVCLVELKARFEEERNIYWAQALEKAGVHVVYGVVGLKTHAKAALVVRQEPDGVRCYVHVGTGNYQAQTARTYTDLSLLTCKSDFAEDVVELFNYLTGRSLKREYRKLLVAPLSMRDRFLAMIEREAEHAKAGRPAQIIVKCNALEERSVCRALYRASQAGAKVDLIIRGFCCLRPGVPGLSENIRVISVIGRFLEHSRLFYFRNGNADPLLGDFYLGSADWMYRNLLARVEISAPIEDRPLRETAWTILQVLLHDRRQAWDMQPDGSYLQRQPTLTPQSGTTAPASIDPAAAIAAKAELLGTHQVLMDLARSRAAAPAQQNGG